MDSSDKEAVKRLRSLSECCICLDAYTDPRLLPCFHTACLKCFEDLQSKNQKKPGDVLPCPLCRKGFSIPAEGMTGLQKNFFIESLMEVTKAFNAENESVLCNTCSIMEDASAINKATVRCLDCCENYCTRCSKMHKSQKLTRDHRIVEINGEFKEEEIRNMLPIRKCPSHSDRDLDYYCGDCKTVVCVSCFVEVHKMHECKDVKKVDKDFRQRLEELLRKISGCKEEILSKKFDMERQKKEYLKKTTETENGIKEKNQQLKALIDQHTEDVLNELSMIKQKHQKLMEAEIEEIERKLTVLESFMTFCTELKSKGSPSEVCGNVDSLITRAEELRNENEEYMSAPKKPFNIQFSATEENKLPQIFGNLIGKLSGSIRQTRPTDFDPLLSDRKPRGLQNLGNTCYFNSVMQSLCNTHVFNSELRNTNKNEKLTLSFRNLVAEMKSKGTQAVEPSKVLYDFVISVSRFNNHGQHDSHECLRHFLDEIRKEQRKTMADSLGNGLLTAVDKIFGGHLVTVYVCKECDKHFHFFEPCLDISLPVFFETETNPVTRETHTLSIEQLIETEKDEVSKVHKYNNQENNYKRSVQKLTKRLNFQSSGSTYSTRRKGLLEIFLSSSTKTSISLDDCLKHFSRVEQINKEYICEDCLREAMARGEADEDNLKLTSATKQTLIFNPPAILTIHFKRFELLPGRSRKRSDMVKYQEYLDVAPYCSSQCLRNDPPRNNIWYSLYAMVVHSGSLEFGHYVAYVKVREGEENARSLSRFLQHKYFNHNITSDELIRMMNKEKQGKSEDSKQPEREEVSKWYLMNDSSVYEVDVEEILKQEAYILFYERVD